MHARTVPLEAGLCYFQLPQLHSIHSPCLEAVVIKCARICGFAETGLVCRPRAVMLQQVRDWFLSGTPLRERSEPLLRAV